MATPHATDPGFAQQLMGYSLTTAEIVYRLPDHPAILQTYIWQEYDYAPEFPVLENFLSFWRREIEGKLHSVNVSCRQLVAPALWRNVTFTTAH